MFSGHGVSVGPGHEVVDPAGGVAVDQAGEGGGQVGLGVDGVELAGLDQRGDDAPVDAALVRRDLMMPGVWDLRSRSLIRSTLCSGGLRS
jgi:hypothetical protein